MSTKRLLSSLFQNKAWANEELFTALRSVDATNSPTERHTAIRILNHTYVVDRIFAANLQQSSHEYTATNTPETPTLDDLYQAVKITDRWYQDYVSELNDEQLGETLRFTFVDGDSGRMSREEMLLHIATHGSYHRGAVGAILTRLAIAPPRDIFTRFLHESEPERRQGQVGQ